MLNLPCSSGKQINLPLVTIKSCHPETNLVKGYDQGQPDVAKANDANLCVP